MNELLVSLGISGWKPMLGTLLLSPTPLLLLALVGAWLSRRRRAVGRAIVVTAVILLWAMCTPLVGTGLMLGLTQPPSPLDTTRINSLKGAQRTAIVVLGGGHRPLAREYGAADLTPMTIDRLRYGAWLARQTHLPLLFSGGLGHSSQPGPGEADIARRVVERDFGMRLRWAENQSRDTNENAIYTVALLREESITQILLVTHGFHQRRALAAFQRAIDRAGLSVQVIPAPMGLNAAGPLVFGDFLPTAEGLMTTRLALHEWLGRLAGA